jgi:hypothetical protein
MSKTQSKLHGLTWAPARRFVLVVRYELPEQASPNGLAAWSEGWAVAAFDADGDPIVLDGEGLKTASELLEQYTDGSRPCSNVGWSVTTPEDHPADVRRVW